MIGNKIFFLPFLILLSSCFFTETPKKDNSKPLQYTSVSLEGNAWIINDVFKSSESILKNGVMNWSNPNHIIRVFFYIDKPATLTFNLKAKTNYGSSIISCTIEEISQQIQIASKELKSINIGTYKIKTSGYHYIDIQGLIRDGEYFGEISDLEIGTEDRSLNIKYIKDDFYFGRRGPSTHLIFESPKDVNVEWFYNEIEVEEKQDVIGSYFMANGFDGGYFGIQVNSETERRILFSIWSPYKTDDPNNIPDAYKIKLLQKGNNVITGEFGNEGSGGQSYKLYNWEVKTRYGFLIRAQPAVNNSTIFAAYFYDPKIGKWELIASFSRPMTNTYLTGLYSFLENFIPNSGVINRSVGFYNQWVRDENENWYEITNAKFSADATAKKEARLDYSGGLIREGFYLQNCGFKNENLKIGTILSRKTNAIPPKIDFNNFDK